MAHTPGPWPEPEYDNHGNGGFSEWWEVGGIAQVHTSEDDARLISAAPDLLAAAQAFDADLSENCDGPARDALRAAIAKATGADL